MIVLRPASEECTTVRVRPLSCKFPALCFLTFSSFIISLEEWKDLWNNRTFANALPFQLFRELLEYWSTKYGVVIIFVLDYSGVVCKKRYIVLIITHIGQLVKVFYTLSVLNNS